MEQPAPALQVPVEGGDLAYYAYAVVRPKPGAPSLREIAGIEPEHLVYAFGAGDLQVMVSAVPLADYAVEPLRERVQDLEWLQSRALAHQRVLVTLLDYYTLLPLKFCTIYLGREGLTTLLEANQAGFGAALERLEGAQEWGMKLLLTRSTLIAWVEQHVPDLLKLGEGVARAGEGARYMLRKRLERASLTAAENQVQQDVQSVYEQLRLYARMGQCHPLPPPAEGGHGEELVLNSAYLVAESELPAFINRLEQLRVDYGERGLRMELTGPWPPYSFAEEQAS